MVLRDKIGYFLPMSRYAHFFYGLAFVALFFMCLIPSSFAQTKTQADEHYAVVYAYFSIGDDTALEYNISKEQFLNHINEISNGDYSITALPDIIKSFKNGEKTKPRAIVITFDGADKSIVNNAAPLLIERKIPFTIFVPTQKISDTSTSSLTWDDLRDLKKTGLVTFGLHPQTYSRLAGMNEEEIKRQINSAKSTLRNELDVETDLFAYPFGEYDKKYQDILKSLGFTAAFGQQSGVAHGRSDMFALPRFTMTQNYSDLDRFVMTSNALPFPVTDITPTTAVLDTPTPSFGFSVDPSFTKKDIQSIQCFSSNDNKPQISILENRIELRFDKISNEKLRVNCTLPYDDVLGGETRWRWFGMLFSVSETALSTF